MGWLSRLFGKKKEKKVKNGGDKSTTNGSKLGFQTRSGELSPEREEEMINHLAKRVLDFGMETPAILFLESVKPLSFLGSQLFLTTSAPFLDLLGIRGDDYATLFMNRENVERLLKKIEEGVKQSSKSSK